MTFNTWIVSHLQEFLQILNEFWFRAGLFSPEHLEYYLNANESLQPTLAEMTSVAIQMMQKEENGYFLFVEGGQIDHGHHASKPHIALSEAHEFHKAIEVKRYPYVHSVPLVRCLTGTVQFHLQAHTYSI